MSHDARSDLVDVEVCLHHETERAYLVSLDGDRDRGVWIPKSAAEFEHKRRNVGILTVSEALAIEKELI